MQIVFKRCRDAFYPRFAELETIVNTAYEYARVVKAIGNALDLSEIQNFDWLPNRTKLSLTVATSHFNDENKLAEGEWQQVLIFCDEIIFLEHAR